jgi:hypothetical protein
MRESHTVEAAYSQFYLNWSTDLGGDFEPNGPGTALVHFSARQMIIFIVMRQDGAIDVEVVIHDSRPTPLGSPWQDVSELSFTPDSPVVLTGWEGEDGDPVLALATGRSYRLRYGIADGDQAHEVYEKPFPERYLLEFWPEPESPPVQVVQTSMAGRYWTGSRAITALRDEFVADPANAELPDEKKVDRFAERVFTELPYVVADIADSTFPWAETMWNPVLLGTSRFLPIEGDYMAAMARSSELMEAQKAWMIPRFTELAAAWPP